MAKVEFKRTRVLWAVTLIGSIASLGVMATPAQANSVEDSVFATVMQAEPTDTAESSEELIVEETETSAPVDDDDNVDKADSEDESSTAVNTDTNQDKLNFAAALGIGALIIGSIAAGGFLFLTR